MANNFCTKCGKPLEEGSAFCTSCGAPVPKTDDAATAPLNAAATAPAATTQTPPAAQAAPAAQAYVKGGTAPMDPVQSQPVNYRAAEAPAANRPAQAPAAAPLNKNLLIIVIAAVVVILAVVLLLTHPWAPTASTSSTSATTASSVQQSSSATASSSSSNTSASDKSTYNSLLSAYNKLDGFDQRIRDCASTYNANTAILNAGLSERTADANTCKALEKEIQQEMSSLSALGITSSSKYYQDYKNISNLQNDLLKRIDVMVQSWNISIKYSNTTGHEKEIYAPIDADNDANGVNIYKTDYLNNYASSKPTEK